MTVLSLKFTNTSLDIDDLVNKVAESKGIQFNGTDEENEVSRAVLAEIIDDTFAKFLSMGSELTIDFDLNKRTAVVAKL